MDDRPSTWPSTTDELLPHTLFNLAASYPDITYAEYPHENIADGYHKITYRELADAVHTLAWWIKENIGRPQKDDGSETLVYMGPNDLRYAVLVLGSVVVGYKMLFPSPRYGVEAITRLIDSVDSKFMLTPETPLPVVSGITSKRSMQTYTIPTVHELLQSSPEPYPYTKTFAQHGHEPLVCLHSMYISLFLFIAGRHHAHAHTTPASGTTGHPKPIPWTHAWASSFVTSSLLPTPHGYIPLDSSLHGPRARLMFMFPPFHASGIIGALLFPLGTGATIIYAPSSPNPITAVQGMADALHVLGEEGRCGVVCAGPPHIEILGSKEGAGLLERVSKRVKSVMWSGGDVSREAGAVISKAMELWTVIGSTELGPWPVLRQASLLHHDQDRHQEQGGLEEDWHYMTFHPALNLRFDPIPGSQDTNERLYEAVMTRNNGVEHGGWTQPIFHIPPHASTQEIHLGDLFTAHPSSPDLWKHAGRADDLITFITGEKFHPEVAERRIASHPGVTEVMFVGTRRVKGALVMRMKEGSGLDDVWRVVEEVNESVPVYARVGRDMIVVVDRPFLRTAKGSVQKRGMLETYEMEIDALYQGVGS